MSDPKSQPTPPATERRDREQQAEQGPRPGLDLSKLDLTIEKVEERIAPSETNVFDK